MTQRRIYQNDFPYFITFVTYKRRKYFYNFEFANLLNLIIIRACEMHGFELFTFQVNSEHIHLMVKKDAERAGATTAGCADDERFDHLHGRKEPSVVPALLDEELDWQWAAELGENHRHFSGLMHSIKSYFWHQIYKKYDFMNKFWADPCFYRIVNTERYFRNTVNYVSNNWIKHHLPEKFSRPPYFYQNKKLIDE